LGLIYGPNSIYQYNDLGCKNAAIFDDLTNGRISNIVDGRFFVGLSPLMADLGTFNGTKINTFFSDSASVIM
jgi:hypothetical protein